MEVQASSQDSGNVSSSLDSFPNLYKSTPKNENEVTPYLNSGNSKKRRFSYCDIRGRNLDELLGICSSTPQASSTLNDSLTKEFEGIQIQQSRYHMSDRDEPSPKMFKTNNCDRLASSGQDFNLNSFECTPKKSGIFQKCSSACSAPSPLKEQHDILYPTLKPLDSIKKHLTPQKFKDKTGPNSTSVKASSYVSESTSRKSFNKILNNDLVMGHVFKYLSNGDLFRLSMVSKGFRDALLNNFTASNRCGIYKEQHKKNKENYKITPPSSPESQCLFPEGSLSPSRINFAKFVEIGSLLNSNQSLMKCPKCEKPSVVEKCIAQCQQVYSCGYIFCQKCNCFAYSPEDFYDKCQDLALCTSVVKRRPQLEDLTNCSGDFSFSSLLNSTADNNYYSSGYFSGYDTSHSPISVKRNLNTSFGNDTLGKGKPPRALFDCNRSPSSSSFTSIKREEKRKLSSYIVPVKCEKLNKPIEMVEPPSPPKVKNYSACSKQSRKSLKRLTR